MRLLWVFCLLWVWEGVWAQSLSVPAAIDEAFKTYGVDREEVSLWVQAVDADVPLVEINGFKQRNPASVAKLLTTAGGLIRLGEDFRWQTQFYVDALPDAQGVVEGNLYVKGGGDPFLVDERFEAMLRALRDSGIRHITGNLVLDNSMFALALEERDAVTFDGQGWQPYNAIPDALMLNFRTLKVRFEPEGSQGVAVSLVPKINSWKVVDELRVLNKAACNREGFSPSFELLRDAQGMVRLQVTGNYSRRCGVQELLVAMGEASELFYYAFLEQWQALGGSVDGQGMLAKVPSTAKLVYVGESLPLADLIEKMNQESNNVMTRQLLLTLGREVFGEPATLQASRAALLQTLSAFGVDTRGMIVDNGAGLSRVTRVSAAQLVMLLRSLYYSDKGEAFMRSLAVAGESGTLRKRYRGEALEGRVFGKTGTINQVRAFAGFVQARSGRDYVVVMLANGKTAVKSRAMQDAVLRWVYER